MPIRTVDELLNEYRMKKDCKEAHKLHFEGVDGYDVYNPTAAFIYKGQKMICARVEKRDSEQSRAIFFTEKEENCFIPAQLPSYELQDPSLTKIGNYYILCGTEIFPHPENENNLWWRAKFYYGEELENLKELAEGPCGMKDIRLVELSDHRIGIFSRPQGIKGGRGKIGFTTIDSLEEFNTKVIDEAPLLNLYPDDEWGGVNEPVLLENGCIGVLGHIAKFTEGDVRHYYPMVFCLNPETGAYSDIEIIAERQDFIEGPSKRPDLVDVLFSGGLVRTEDGYAELYVGVSDCEVQKMKIKDPFQAMVI